MTLARHQALRYRAMGVRWRPGRSVFSGTMSRAFGLVYTFNIVNFSNCSRRVTSCCRNWLLMVALHQESGKLPQRLLAGGKNKTWETLEGLRLLEGKWRDPVRRDRTSSASGTQILRLGIHQCGRILRSVCCCSGGSGSDHRRWLDHRHARPGSRRARNDSPGSAIAGNPRNTPGFNLIKL
mgnify:CR=1 FL=1